MSDRVDILGVPLVPWTVDEFTRWVLDAGGGGSAKPVFVTYLNAWCSHVAARDGAYEGLLREADAVYADGQAVVWASRFLGRPLPERVNAGDFINELLREAAGRGLSVFLVGSAAGVAEAAAEAWTAQVPGLRVAGVCHGYWDDDGEAAARQIAEASPDLLLVGLGVPRQEKWAAERLGSLNAQVVWCVGALFEYYGGARARAPVWMRRAGLEWLFRLALEPRRLAYRYIVGNASFVWRVFRARLSR